VTEIVKADGRLWWVTPRGQRFELFGAADGSFFLKAADYTLQFVRDDAGRVTRVDLRAGSERASLTRL
jgi:hypothetical protein